MKRHRGADALCSTLKRVGVTRIFTVSGNHVMALFDGTFGFHAMEIDTAMCYQLPFVAVIGNEAFPATTP